MSATTPAIGPSVASVPRPVLEAISDRAYRTPRRRIELPDAWPIRIDADRPRHPGGELDIIDERGEARA